ncbi:transketolase [Magnetococcales bacterium HHB-1]
MTLENSDRLSVNALRMLSVDMISKAKSGHPGLPLGAAPMAYALWHRVMRHNSKDPQWLDRDRFILSAGHGSALLYALLHLSGYPLSMADVQQFRQRDSLTPGHPEFGHTVGVEATTGPLGQGFAMGVGMALAERRMAQSFNHPDFLPIVNHYTYALVSDGDLMEGISAEAASLAGHLCLGKLIYLYDDNKISIEGRTDLAFSEDVTLRFEACQWQVLTVEDGEDLDAIEAAIKEAQAEEERPTLIKVRTRIGFGSPWEDTPTAHGSPLKTDERNQTAETLRWPYEAFDIPGEVYDHFQAGQAKNVDIQEEWLARVEAMKTRYPGAIERFIAQYQGQLPIGWDDTLNALDFGNAPIATRSASGKALNALAPQIPALIGGSADLGPSNNTRLFGVEEEGIDVRNIHFGVREHAMGAICNGIALHGGQIPFCGTFLVFSDYMRSAIRSAAMMQQRVIFVLTHDSISVGEDGPTHQPIEHLPSLRAMPDLLVIRPADGPETVAAWRIALQHQGPTALILSRQKLPLITDSTKVDAQVEKGAYILSDQEQAELILIATGGETQLALAAQDELLKTHHIASRVVSMPCWELFQSQSDEYQQQILPKEITARISIEAASSLGWHAWVGCQGKVIGVDRFGMSAPGGEILKQLGFSVENVVQSARQLLNR